MPELGLSPNPDGADEKCLAVVGAMLGTSLKLWEEVRDHKKQDVALQDKYQSAKQQLAPLAEETTLKLSEAERHRRMREQPKEVVLASGGQGSVSADYFASDGCLKISRTHESGGAYGISDSQDLWIPDPSRQVSAERGQNGLPSDDSKPVPVTWLSNSQVGLQRSGASVTSVSKAHLQPARYQGGCLNPHPGVFQINNVQVNAYVVQVWRRFRRWLHTLSTV